MTAIDNAREGDGVAAIAEAISNALNLRWQDAMKAANAVAAMQAQQGAEPDDLSGCRARLEDDGAGGLICKTCGHHAAARTKTGAPR